MNKDIVVQTNIAFIPESGEDWEILKELWDQLKDDSGFFLFFEGDYIQLRCSNENSPKVLEWAKKHDKQINGFETWQEPWEHTKKYQDWYLKLFHLYAEAMFMFDSREDFKYAADRVMHLFLNTQYQRVVAEKVGKTLPVERIANEAMITATVAVERAVLCGYMAGQAATKKKEASKE